MKVVKNFFKKLSLWCESKLREGYCRRYYRSLEELPVWNWWKVHETKDLAYLLKSKKKLTIHAAIIFDDLHSEFIRIFGVSDSYKAYLDKLKEIEILEIDKILNKDEFIQTLIDVAKVELEDIKSGEKDSNYLAGAIAVEKFMGFKLNPKEMSVFEYYSYINQLEKSVGNGK